ncbi:hypothetical protein C2S51_008415 [Perilla frutescens var. frutescens]|nr:hypothetical protein C2S51_008415 [Perilla frutescens var. frutescens]
MAPEALHHGRSLSLPSASHPAISEFDENLSRLRSSEASCSSLSSMKGTINGLRKLYESIDDLVLLTHIQEMIISEECVDDYIRLLDACSTVKDVMSVAKQDLRELLSAVRRRDVDGISGYLASRRKSKKMIQKSLNKLRRCASASSDSERESAEVSMLKDAESVAYSLLESLLAYTLGKKTQESKSRSWSLVSKLMNSNKVSNEENEFNKLDSFLQRSQHNELVNHLKQMDSSIQVVEDELESTFRQLIKTRVSLLNILNN